MLSSSSRHGLRTSLDRNWALCAMTRVGSTCLGSLRLSALIMASRDSTVLGITLSHPFLSSYHHHLPRKLGTMTGVTPPSLVDCSPLLKYGGKLSCCTTLASVAVSQRSDPSSDAPRMPPPTPPRRLLVAPLLPYGGWSPASDVGNSP